MLYYFKAVFVDDFRPQTVTSIIFEEEQEQQHLRPSQTSASTVSFAHRKADESNG